MSTSSVSTFSELAKRSTYSNTKATPSSNSANLRTIRCFKFLVPSTLWSLQNLETSQAQKETSCRDVTKKSYGWPFLKSLAPELVVSINATLNLWQGGSSQPLLGFTCIWRLVGWPQVDCEYMTQEFMELDCVRQDRCNVRMWKSNSTRGTNIQQQDKYWQQKLDSQMKKRAHQDGPFRGRNWNILANDLFAPHKHKHLTSRSTRWAHPFWLLQTSTRGIHELG